MSALGGVRLLLLTFAVGTFLGMNCRLIAGDQLLEINAGVKSFGYHDDDTSIVVSCRGNVIGSSLVWYK